MGPNYRKNAAALIAVITRISIPSGLRPSDKILAKLIRRRENKVLEFAALVGVRNVTDTKFYREEEEKKIGEGVKLVAEGNNRTYRFLGRKRKLYQAIKVLLRGYLLPGATECAGGKLFVLNTDGAHVLNRDGASKRKKVCCSRHVIYH